MIVRILVFIILISIIASAAVAQQQSDKLTRSQKKAEIQRIQSELKELREKARESQPVKELRKKIDELMAEYYRTLRNEMIRIDPSKKELIEREAELQRQLRSKKRQTPKE